MISIDDLNNLGFLKNFLEILLLIRFFSIDYYFVRLALDLKSKRIDEEGGSQICT
ncbi:MAG: hypothetical protein BAJALOKI3v1_20047 [Promethearchaeota archaeon]|jgi:hypothetical protein|nr:MAG: hypothetical protein BAJALOKI3v1_20047 [Candidatus Lokiarchaeota archaeon]